jgi:hypothetical protein
MADPSSEDVSLLLKLSLVRAFFSDLSGSGLSGSVVSFFRRLSLLVNLRILLNPGFQSYVALMAAVSLSAVSHVTDKDKAPRSCPAQPCNKKVKLQHSTQTWSQAWSGIFVANSFESSGER